MDLYVGGTEHAVLHLLYARFWHKVLFDLGHVSTPEPFFKLVNQGLILGEDGQKMSKSRGNVINPDDILVEYGADAFRLYEMFMGPLEMVKPWSTKGVEGRLSFSGPRLAPVRGRAERDRIRAEPDRRTAARRRAAGEASGSPPASATSQPTAAQLKALHACIKKVTEDLDGLRFNTAISALMVFINEAMTWETKPVSVLRDFLILLQPFAPHLAEELWAKLHATRNTQHAASPRLRRLAGVRSGLARRGHAGNPRPGERQTPRRDQGARRRFPGRPGGRGQGLRESEAVSGRQDDQEGHRPAEEAGEYRRGLSLLNQAVEPIACRRLDNDLQLRADLHR